MEIHTLLAFNLLIACLRKLAKPASKMVWISNHTRVKQWDAITHPSFKQEDAITYPQLQQWFS